MSTQLMPAEWTRHAATWIAWPHNESDWPGKLAPIPWVYTEIIRALTRRVRIVAEEGGGHGAMGSTVTVVLAGGRRLERHVDSGLLAAGELPDKFTRLTRAGLGERSAALYERLQLLETEPSLDWLGAP